MKISTIRLQFFSSLIILFLSSGQIAQARPFSVFKQFDDDKKIERKPLPPINYVRSRDFDQKHISLDLRFDWDKEQTFGIEEFTFSPLKPNFTILNLDAGLMIFDSVKIKGGEELEFSYDEKNSKLSIKLDKAYNVGDEITVVIDYQTKGELVANTLGFGGGGGLKFVKPKNPTPTNPRQIWSQGESEYSKYWFPSYDYPNDFRTTEIKATVKKPLQVISNGKLINTKDNGNGTRTFHWKMDTPYTNYLTSIVVGEFAEIKAEYDGIPISTYVYKPWLKEGKVTAKRLPAMMKFFSEKIFKYPYVKYAQTIGNTFSGGMENITATTQTDNMISDARTELDGDRDGLQAHELVHHWFGNYVTCRDWSEIWLNEGFATYMESLWQLESKGKDYFLFNEVRANQNGYYGSWNQGNRHPIVTKYYANPDAVFDAYAYPRGGAVLHMLRKQLGDKNFWRAIRHYLKSNANQPVQTEDLRIAIEEATGQSMDAFFDQWIYKMGHPVFEVKQSFDQAKSQLILNVKQVQKMDLTSNYPQVKYFQTPVEIEIVTDRSTKVETVFIEPKMENVFKFEVDGKVKLVDFDNEGTLIKEVKFEKPIDELIYQATSDKDVLGRNWAMSELTKIARKKETSRQIKNKIASVLGDVITKEKTWQLRQGAIRQIRSIFAPNGNLVQGGIIDSGISLSEPMIAQIIKATKDKKSRVRAEAISLLTLTKNKNLASLYQNAITTDKSYTVIDRAAEGLARTRNGNAYSTLRKIAQSDSWRNRVRIAGLNGLATLEDKRALDLGFKYGADESQPANLRSAGLKIVAAVGKDDPRAYPLIFGDFKRALDNNSFQSMFNGIQSIIKLANPKGQEAFDLMKKKFATNPQFMNFINSQEAQFKKALESKK